MDETGVRLTFSKATVRPHTRTSRSGKRIAVDSYTTKRPPGRARQPVIHSMGHLADMPFDMTLRAKAAPCQHAMRGSARQDCGCEPCKVWRSLKSRQTYHQKTTFKKAISRLDDFLRKRWRQAASLFKSEAATTTQDVEGQHAEDTLGATRAPGTIIVAEDHASAMDLGPEHDEETQGGEDLPWAAEDHASAPKNPDGAEAEVEALAKAKQVRADLQKAIADLDARLAHHLPAEERGQLLQQHLDYLIHEDALAGRLEQAERIAKHADV